MKENTFDDSTLDNIEINKSTVVESNIINSHEENMGKMLDKSQSIVTQIKKLSQEISKDLKSQNKLINEIGLTVNKTDEELSEIINQAFAEAVHKVLLERDDFYALYTTGGDITAAVNDVLETSGLVLLDEVVPLAGYGVTLGGKFSGLQFISKGGMVGDDNAMVTCVQYLIDHF